MPQPSKGRLVYSTGGGRICPGCGRPAADCACDRREPAAPVRPGDGTVRVRLDRKGRRGKSVTVVEGLPGTEEALRALAAELKRACGSGGSVKEGAIEIQGDRRDRVLAELGARGFRVKRSGG